MICIATIYYALNKASRYLRYITHSLRYTRLSPLFEEMSLAADCDERKLDRRLLDTRLFYFFTYRLLFGIHVAIFSVLRARQGKNFEKKL